MFEAGHVARIDLGRSFTEPHRASSVVCKGNRPDRRPWRGYVGCVPSRRNTTWPITAVATAVFGLGLLALAGFGYDEGKLDGVIVPPGVTFVVASAVLWTVLLRRR
jgi:hypothetical protein